jgi:hypothetical protein
VFSTAKQENKTIEGWPKTPWHDPDPQLTATGVTPEAIVRVFVPMKLMACMSTVTQLHPDRKKLLRKDVLK